MGDRSDPMRTQKAYPQSVETMSENALGDDQTIDLLNVVGMLRRRKWLILLGDRRRNGARRSPR